MNRLSRSRIDVEDTVWLLEFHKLFPEATERSTEKRQELALVEQQAQAAVDQGRVDAKVLAAIESSEAWSYPNWWPKLSRVIEEPIILPSDLSSPAAQRQAVRRLFGSLKHIEVVSVVLRFLAPKEFGIISPPNSGLLNLAPHSDHEEYYLEYLAVLNAMLEHYGVLERVADVDQALWSAAQLSRFPDYAALTEDMYGDEYFQELRVSGLLKRLSDHRIRSRRQRILLSKALLRVDHVAAALVASRVLEQLIVDMGRRWGVRGEVRKGGQTRAGALVDGLGREPEPRRFLDSMDVNLKTLWRLRRDSVHETVSVTGADSLVRAIQKLARFE